jgi:hypothetical protein
MQAMLLHPDDLLSVANSLSRSAQTPIPNTPPELSADEFGLDELAFGTSASLKYAHQFAEQDQANEQADATNLRGSVEDYQQADNQGSNHFLSIFNSFLTGH